MKHPADGESSPSGHDVGHPALLFQPRDGALGDTAMNGDKINAVTGIIFDSRKNAVGGHFNNGAFLLYGLNAGLVNGHCSDCF